MTKTLATLLGKSIRSAMRLRGSGGQALPGLVIEKLAPNYLPDMLNQLPEGVVVITGTNGKTTTTKMVVELLKSQGKRVLTNSTGSNMTRGIISSVASSASWQGKLNFDIAVFELDEAFAKHFTKAVTPTWVLSLNVSRDQLDRFGEVDAVARLLGETMATASIGVVTNANDPLLVKISAELGLKNVHYFGVGENMRKHFPTDSEIVAVDDTAPAEHNSLIPIKSLVELVDFKDHEVVFTINNSTYKLNLKLDGQHNFLNAAAALSLVIKIIPGCNLEQLIKTLEKLEPAFGRGEHYKLKNDTNLQLALVKNPASFRQSLASYLTPGTKIMIAINDNYADSRDMSWLWDVDFTPLREYEVVLTTGSRAADMALRLSYDDVSVKVINEDLDTALQAFCNESGNKLILSSYTAMLWLHKKLATGAGKKL